MERQLAVVYNLSFPGLLLSFPGFLVEIVFSSFQLSHSSIPQSAVQHQQPLKVGYTELVMLEHLMLFVLSGTFLSNPTLKETSCKQSESASCRKALFVVFLPPLLSLETLLEPHLSTKGFTIISAFSSFVTALSFASVSTGTLLPSVPSHSFSTPPTLLYLSCFSD